ncbi:hypothetical protein SAMN05660835_01520 [Desulfurella multipotens]|uniref:Uncharacterized protein n=1 Tax=Desulfurella multipotens TaxID=79269 RepID=A0A1G6Q9X1_9BACT|nr:hypothetical protein [Desulfurella multipotens]SDC88455.1 hypothetical protein SAMN05660835_01520 [Desulfurella multipotens]
MIIVIKSKYYLYQTVNDYLEALLEYLKAQADLLGLIGYNDNIYKENAISNKNQNIIKKIEDMYKLNKIHYQNEAYLNWYAWNSFALYKRLGEDFWDKIPKSTRSVFLSLNSQEIQMINTKPDEANILDNFIKQANKRNIKVELLLGDPYWVLEKYRHQLISIIKSLNKFGFSGIQLDIEKSQLPKNDRYLWDKGIIKTIS